MTPSPTTPRLPALGLVSLLLLAVPLAAQDPPGDEDSAAEASSSAATVEVDSDVPDEAIRERIEQILTSGDYFAVLDVEVRHGVVFLRGETHEDANREWAVRIAGRVEGVVSVIEEIEVPRVPIDWTDIGSHLLHLLVALVLALPVALDRERVGHSAGIRTFPLVSVASCGYMLIALYSLPDGDAQARVMYGIITGIGFIGGGAILKDKLGVQGTATAASIWNTAAIGVAVAWRHFEIAVALSAINIVTLRVGRSLKARVPEDPNADGEENGASAG